MAGHRFVYGPVASRRLGFSLGVDIIPFKTCSLDCVYCQLGSAGKATIRRGSWFPPEEILAQIKAALGSGQRIDVITFSGSGEPTLSRDIGRLIRADQADDPRPRRGADQRDPPHPEGRPARPRRGRHRRAFARRRHGRRSSGASTGPTRRSTTAGSSTVSSASATSSPASSGSRSCSSRGVNDSPAAIRALKAAVARIRPDRIELNTVVRPPADARRQAARRRRAGEDPRRARSQGGDRRLVRRRRAGPGLGRPRAGHPGHRRPASSDGGGHRRGPRPSPRRGPQGPGLAPRPPPRPQDRSRGTNILRRAARPELYLTCPL